MLQDACFASRPANQSWWSQQDSDLRSAYAHLIYSQAQSPLQDAPPSSSATYIPHHPVHCGEPRILSFEKMVEAAGLEPAKRYRI